MGCIMQCAYRQAVGVSVPCPQDANAPEGTLWWYDHVAKQAPALAAAGITALLLPPVLRTSANTLPGADGYGTHDDYDLDFTRFGNREQLQRMCAIAKANGLQLYADMVLHQRSGGNNGYYTYASATGKTNGRFPKHPSCFWKYNPDGTVAAGYVARDPIAGPVSDDFAFGDPFAPVNSLPTGYVMGNLVAASLWLGLALDLDGTRDDDVKGQAIETTDKFANTGYWAGKVVIGEYDDGNPDNVGWWVWNSGLNGRCYAFDFPLHYVLEGMCNNTSRWDMRRLEQAGFAGRSPLQAVTFVENPDTDTDGFASIIWDKILAYAFILTSEGYPVIYWRDYSTDIGCYGLLPWINNLIWIHEQLAGGNTTFLYRSFQCVVYGRDSGLIVGLNNDQYNGWTTLTVNTARPNTRYHDYSGNNQMDCWSDENGFLTFGVPPNNNGHGYVCFYPSGSEGLPIHRSIQSTTQTFFGAADLKIGPVLNKDTVLPVRIYCEAGEDLIAEMFVDRTGWTAKSWAGLEIVAPSGNRILAGYEGNETGTIKKEALSEYGWHTITVSGGSLPAAGSNFELRITYQAPQEG